MMMMMMMQVLEHVTGPYTRMHDTWVKHRVCLCACVPVLL